jgi:dolichyl-phosphate beta-glucosyltransferase
MDSRIETLLHLIHRSFLKNFMTESFTLILPCYNEADAIKENLVLIMDELQTVGRDFEILVVDDGSSDGTVERVKEIQSCYPDRLRLLHQTRNRGKGGSVKNGVCHAQGNIVFFTDADRPYRLDKLSKAFTLFENGADVVIGARNLSESSSHIPRSWMRQTTSWFFSFLVNQIFNELNIWDTQCGLKGFTQKTAKEIFMRTREEGFAFDVELLVISRCLGLNIQKVPVEQNVTSPTSLNLIFDPLQMLLSLLNIRKRKSRGDYSLVSRQPKVDRLR